MILRSWEAILHFNEHLLLWNRASIKIMDIRHITMQRKEGLHSYRFPASCFLYTVRGNAVIQLDGKDHQVSRFHVLHGGKGCCLNILPVEEVLEYYMIYYKAIIPLPERQDILALMEHRNPFKLQYGFAPDQPVSLLSKVQYMMTAWEEQEALEQFHVKSLFYQFVYELLWQIHNGRVPTIKPDLVAQMKYYMQEHYAEPITMDLLAELMDSSPRHLSRLFKRQTGYSPIDFVIQIRMNKAKELLLATDATLQEIAKAVGYPDGYYLAKIFKKYMGIAPIRYRKQHESPNVPSNVARLGIVQDLTSLYIDNDYHNQHIFEEELLMYRSRKTPLAITLLLCLSLLLSACSTGGAGSPAANEGSQKPTNQVSANNANNTDTQSQMKTVTTIKGDIEVPVNPQRVVVLYLMGDLLALGVNPVGISSIEEGAAFASELEGATSLGAFKPDPEAVTALNPDLIIVTNEEIYEGLKMIAPTVYIPYDLPVEERMNLLGEILGKEGQAQEMLDNLHKKVEQSKEKLEQAGILDKTVTIMESNKGSMAVMTGLGYGRGSQIIYQYLGMKAPEVLQREIENARNDATSKDVSYEVLPEYVGDYIFRSSFEGMVDLSDNSIWNNIPAVKEGRLIDMSFGLFFYNDIYSLDKQLDFIVDNLLKTAE